MQNTGDPKNILGAKFDKTIFFGALFVLLPLTLPLLIWPDDSLIYLNTIKDFVVGNFGMAYIWLSIFTLAFVVWLAFSKYGRFLASDYGKTISRQTLGVDGHTETLSNPIIIHNNKKEN
jgi:hypothetical protein